MADKYQNSTVISGNAGNIIMNHSEGREHMIFGAHSGAQMTLNGPGVTLFSPNNTQHHTINDSFKSVGKDDSTYVKGIKYVRAEKGINMVVGDTKSITTNAYQQWNKQVSEYAALNCSPDVKIPVNPVLPGVPIEEIPPINEKAKITKLPNSGISEIQNKSNSGKTPNNIAIPGDALTKKPSLGFIKDLVTKSIQNAISDAKKLADNTVNAIKSIPNIPQAFAKNLGEQSPSTEGATAEPGPTPEQRADAAAATQKQLVDIESQLGEGGDYVICASRNMRFVCGAAVNNNPQAYVDLTGRQVPAGTCITENGVTTVPAAAPKLVEVDNHSYFPCGHFTLEVGNGFNVKTGGGGINLSTCGTLNLQTDSIVKIGALQTVVGGKDIVIAGDTNVSISSSNLNLTSDTQIFLNGNVGVNQNLIVQGGGYFDGNLTCNSITAPQEIQQTLIGFTKEGARGFLRSGDKITGNILIKQIEQGDVTVDATFEFEITLDQQPGLAVELTPHGHEFPNIPLQLVRGDDGASANQALRGGALTYNSIESVVANAISNSNKYPKENRTYSPTNDSSQNANVTGV
jgi:hypothetical protein